MCAESDAEKSRRIREKAKKIRDEGIRLIDLADELEEKLFLKQKLVDEASESLSDTLLEQQKQDIQTIQTHMASLIREGSLFLQQARHLDNLALEKMKTEKLDVNDILKPRLSNQMVIEYSRTNELNPNYPQTTILSEDIRQPEVSWPTSRPQSQSSFSTTKKQPITIQNSITMSTIPTAIAPNAHESSPKLCTLWLETSLCTRPACAYRHFCLDVEERTKVALFRCERQADFCRKVLKSIEKREDCLSRVKNCVNEVERAEIDATEHDVQSSDSSALHQSNSLPELLNTPSRNPLRPIISTDNRASTPQLHSSSFKTVPSKTLTEKLLTFQDVVLTNTKLPNHTKTQMPYTDPYATPNKESSWSLPNSRMMSRSANGSRHTKTPVKVRNALNRLSDALMELRRATVELAGNLRHWSLADIASLQMIDTNGSNETSQESYIARIAIRGPKLYGPSPGVHTKIARHTRDADLHGKYAVNWAYLGAFTNRSEATRAYETARRQEAVQVNLPLQSLPSSTLILYHCGQHWGIETPSPPPHLCPLCQMKKEVSFHTKPDEQKMKHGVIEQHCAQFVWCGKSYLQKMSNELHFMRHSRPIVVRIGRDFPFRDNPLMLHPEFRLGQERSIFEWSATVDLEAALLLLPYRHNQINVSEISEWIQTDKFIQAALGREGMLQYVDTERPQTEPTLVTHSRPMSCGLRSTLASAQSGPEVLNKASRGTNDQEANGSVPQERPLSIEYHAHGKKLSLSLPLLPSRPNTATTVYSTSIDPQSRPATSLTMINSFYQTHDTRSPIMSSCISLSNRPFTTANARSRSYSQAGLTTCTFQDRDNTSIYPKEDSLCHPKDPKWKGMQVRGKNSLILMTRLENVERGRKLQQERADLRDELRLELNQSIVDETKILELIKSAEKLGGSLLELEILRARDILYRHRRTEYAVRLLQKIWRGRIGRRIASFKKKARKEHENKQQLTKKIATDVSKSFANIVIEAGTNRTRKIFLQPIARVIRRVHGSLVSLTAHPPVHKVHSLTVVIQHFDKGMTSRRDLFDDELRDIVRISPGSLDMYRAARLKPTSYTWLLHDNSDLHYEKTAAFVPFQTYFAVQSMAKQQIQLAHLASMKLRRALLYLKMMEHSCRKHDSVCLEARQEVDKCLRLLSLSRSELDLRLSTADAALAFSKKGVHEWGNVAIYANQNPWDDLEDLASGPQILLKHRASKDATQRLKDTKESILRMRHLIRENLDLHRKRVEASQLVEFWKSKVAWQHRLASRARESEESALCVLRQAAHAVLCLMDFRYRVIDVKSDTRVCCYPISMRGQHVSHCLLMLTPMEWKKPKQRWDQYVRHGIVIPKQNLFENQTKNGVFSLVSIDREEERDWWRVHVLVIGCRLENIYPRMSTLVLFPEEIHQILKNIAPHLLKTISMDKKRKISTKNMTYQEKIELGNVLVRNLRFRFVDGRLSVGQLLHWRTEQTLIKNLVKSVWWRDMVVKMCRRKEPGHLIWRGWRQIQGCQGSILVDVYENFGDLCIVLRGKNTNSNRTENSSVCGELKELSQRYVQNVGASWHSMKCLPEIDKYLEEEEHPNVASLLRERPHLTLLSTQVELLLKNTCIQVKERSSHILWTSCVRRCLYDPHLIATVCERLCLKSKREVHEEDEQAENIGFADKSECDLVSHAHMGGFYGRSCAISMPDDWITAVCASPQIDPVLFDDQSEVWTNQVYLNQMFDMPAMIAEYKPTSMASSVQSYQNGGVSWNHPILQIRSSWYNDHVLRVWNYQTREWTSPLLCSRALYSKLRTLLHKFPPPWIPTPRKIIKPEHIFSVCLVLCSTTVAPSVLPNFSMNPLEDKTDFYFESTNEKNVKEHFEVPQSHNSVIVQPIQIQEQYYLQLESNSVPMTHQEKEIMNSGTKVYLGLSLDWKRFLYCIHRTVHRNGKILEWCALVPGAPGGESSNESGIFVVERYLSPSVVLKSTLKAEEQLREILIKKRRWDDRIQKQRVDWAERTVKGFIGNAVVTAWNKQERISQNLVKRLEQARYKEIISGNQALFDWKRSLLEHVLDKFSVQNIQSCDIVEKNKILEGKSHLDFKFSPNSSTTFHLVHNRQNVQLKNIENEQNPIKQQQHLILFQRWLILQKDEKNRSKLAFMRRLFHHCTVIEEQSNISIISKMIKPDWFGVSYISGHLTIVKSYWLDWSMNRGNQFALCDRVNRQWLFISLYLPESSANSVYAVDCHDFYGNYDVEIPRFVTISLRGVKRLRLDTNKGLYISGFHGDARTDLVDCIPLKLRRTTLLFRRIITLPDGTAGGMKQIILSVKAHQSIGVDLPTLVNAPSLAQNHRAARQGMKAIIEYICYSATASRTWKCGVFDDELCEFALQATLPMMMLEIDWNVSAKDSATLSSQFADWFTDHISERVVSICQKEVETVVRETNSFLRKEANYFDPPHIDSQLIQATNQSIKSTIQHGQQYAPVLTNTLSRIGHPTIFSDALDKVTPQLTGHNPHAFSHSFAETYAKSHMLPDYAVSNDYFTSHIEVKEKRMGANLVSPLIRFSTLPLAFVHSRSMATSVLPIQLIPLLHNMVNDRSMFSLIPGSTNDDARLLNDSLARFLYILGPYDFPTTNNHTLPYCKLFGSAYSAKDLLLSDDLTLWAKLFSLSGPLHIPIEDEKDWYQAHLQKQETLRQLKQWYKNPPHKWPLWRIDTDWRNFVQTNRQNASILSILMLSKTVVASNKAGVWIPGSWLRQISFLVAKMPRYQHTIHSQPLLDMLVLRVIHPLSCDDQLSRETDECKNDSLTGNNLLYASWSLDTVLRRKIFRLSLPYFMESMNQRNVELWILTVKLATPKDLYQYEATLIHSQLNQTNTKNPLLMRLCPDCDPQSPNQDIEKVLLVEMYCPTNCITLYVCRCWSHAWSAFDTFYTSIHFSPHQKEDKFLLWVMESAIDMIKSQFNRLEHNMGANVPPMQERYATDPKKSEDSEICASHLLQYETSNFGSNARSTIAVKGLSGIAHAAIAYVGKSLLGTTRHKGMLADHAKMSNEESLSKQMRIYLVEPRDSFTRIKSIFQMLVDAAHTLGTSDHSESESYFSSQSNDTNHTRNLFSLSENDISRIFSSIGITKGVHFKTVRAFIFGVLMSIPKDSTCTKTSNENSLTCNSATDIVCPLGADHWLGATRLVTFPAFFYWWSFGKRNGADSFMLTKNVRPQVLRAKILLKFYLWRCSQNSNVKGES